MTDTAGQEMFKSLVESYYRNADCCLLVYDITNEKSFLEIKNYYTPNIKEKCKKNIKVALLGNKTDLKDQRQVSSKEGADFALENNYTFMETSCVEYLNVSDAFESLVEETNIELQKNKVINKNIQINNTQINSHQNSTCFC